MENGNKSWWSKRTSLEKTLTVVSTLGALLSIALLVSLIVVAVNNGSNDDETTTSGPVTTTSGPEITTILPEITTIGPEATTVPGIDSLCLTQACIAESSTVLSQMNQEANPCDDFYEFACGTFVKDAVIPDDKTQITAFSVIENQLKEQLRVIVNEPIDDVNEIEPFKNVKRLYRACANIDQIEALGSTPVADILTQMGGWPATVGAIWDVDGSWSWQQSVANSRSFGYSVSYFLSFSVSTDNKDTLKRVIRIDQASLGLSREYLITDLEEPFRDAYHAYQKALAGLFGATETLADSDMKDALDFEIELAKISLAREDRRDAEALYNPMTVTELSERFTYAGHDWLTYFNSILPTESQLVESDIIIVGAISFFEQLGDLLARTPPRVLANYVAWRTAVGSVSYLSSEFRQLGQAYNQVTSGRTEEDPRWLQCVDRTLDFFPHAFGSMYVRRHFKEDAKAKAMEMVNNIKDEFKIILSEIDWMDDVTKEGANEKADTIASQIGFADELMDDVKISEYYASFMESLVVDENIYYQSVFNLNIASSNRANKRLREPIDKNEWTSFVTPAIVNAFYSSLENSIKFPAGILQGAFFNADRPQYMNYGGIGFVIGHEITHGFDDQGSQYDASGNLRNWWADSTRAAYLEKAQCIIDQYGNYVEPQTNLNLNGQNTQGENIADNGGIKESYRAYVRWAENNPEQRMPGLNFTPNQMFWVSAAQIWCNVYREEAMKNRVTTGVHSPGQFRVLGPMSNAQQFADDFNCPAGSNMNPVSKCSVW